MQLGETFDPYDLDRPEFNSSLYMQRLANSCSLSNAIRREHNISREIYALESEMRSLVYDNYNKFLLSTDTLGKLKFDIGKMEEDMLELSSKMEEIYKCSQNTVRMLGKRKSKISQLLSKHHALKKLSTILDFVPRLKLLVESGQYQLAVKQYLKAKQFLITYGLISAFTSMKEEAEVVVNDLIKTLMDRFKTEDYIVADLIEGIHLLQQLGQPVLILCKDFLRTAENRINKALPGFNQSETCDIENLTSSLKIAELYSTFLEHILTDIQIYANLFLNNLSGQKEKNVDFSIKELKCFVTKMKNSFFEKSPENEVLKNICSIENVEFLDVMSKLYQSLMGINKLVQNTDLVKIWMQIIFDTCHHRCNQMVEELKRSFNNVLDKLLQQLRDKRISECNSLYLLELHKDLEESFLSVSKSLTSHFNKFIRSDATEEHNFGNLFFKNFVFQDVIIPFIKYANFPPVVMTLKTDFRSYPSDFPLILSNFYNTKLKVSVAAMFDLPEEVFIQPSEDLDLSALEMISNQECSDIAEALLLIYVRKQSERMSRMIQVSMQSRNWLESPEPRRARPLIRRFLEEIASINEQLSQLYQDTSHDRSMFTPLRSLKNRLSIHSETSNIEYNIRNLFSDRVDLFAKPTFTRSSVVNSIVTLCLKNFREYVRLATFSEFGLQQIQVDLHCLKLHFYRIVNEDLIVRMADEILSDCIRRCLSPVLMEKTLLKATHYRFQEHHQAH